MRLFSSILYSDWRGLNFIPHFREGEIQCQGAKDTQEVTYELEANTGPTWARCLPGVRCGSRAAFQVCCAESLSCVGHFAAPTDRSLPGSSVCGILRARILEWVHALLQGIFPAQGSNPGPSHCGADS